MHDCCQRAGRRLCSRRRCKHRIVSTSDRRRVNTPICWNFSKNSSSACPSWGKVQPGDFTKLLNKVRERPDAVLLESVLLRSQSLAVYSAENRGHFGLALDAYAHFTSPIRRYPDLWCTVRSNMLSVVRHRSVSCIRRVTWLHWH